VKNKRDFFENCLKDFSGEASAKYYYEYPNSKIDISGIDFPDSNILFLILTELKKFNWSGAEEKLLWTIPFQYKNYKLMFTVQKFGLRLYSRDENAPGFRIIKEIEHKLKKTLRVLPELLEELFNKRRKIGAVSVPNYISRLTEIFDYHFVRAKNLFNVQEKEDEAFNYFVPMIHLFFSRLEHLLILLLPFSDSFQSRNIEIVGFLKLNWRDQFKHIFRLADGSPAKQFYDAFIDIRGLYRNRFSHGMFKRDLGSIRIHIPGIPPVPIELSDIDCLFEFGGTLVKYEKFSEIEKLILQFEEFLRTSSYRNAIRYIYEGFEISFSDSAMERYKAILDYDQDSMNHCIECEHRFRDDQMNMDW